MQETIEGFIKFIFGNTAIFDAYQALLKLPSDYPTAWTLAENIYSDILIPVAYSIMICLFLIHLIDKASFQELNTTLLLKSFLKLFVSAYVIAVGWDLLGYFCDFGGGLLTAINTKAAVGNQISASGNSSAVTSMLEYSKNQTNNYKSFFSCMGLITSLIIPLLASFIINLIIRCICLIRMLELVLKTMFAPIALCDTFLEGQHSNCVRYCKNYVAVCLQSSVIIATLYIYNSLSADWVTNSLATVGSADFSFFNFVVSYLVLSFAAAALIVKSNTFCKELIGTQ